MCMQERKLKSVLPSVCTKRNPDLRETSEDAPKRTVIIIIYDNDKMMI